VIPPRTLAASSPRGGARLGAAGVIPPRTLAASSPRGGARLGAAGVIPPRTLAAPSPQGGARLGAARRRAGPPEAASGVFARLHLDVAAAAGKLGQCRKRHGQLPQHIVDGDDADQRAVAVDHRHPPDAVHGHQADRVAIAPVFIDRDDLPLQQVPHLEELRIDARRHDFHHDVAVRDDADRDGPAVDFVDHQDIADMVLTHQTCRRADRCGARCADDITNAEFADGHGGASHSHGRRSNGFARRKSGRISR